MYVVRIYAFVYFGIAITDSRNSKTASTPSTLMFICRVCVSVSVYTLYSHFGTLIQCHPCGYDYTKSV